MNLKEIRKEPQRNVEVFVEGVWEFALHTEPEEGIPLTLSPTPVDGTVWAKVWDYFGLV